jgi:anaerobic ribonucleoside-triphosphate reductase activating protein
MMVIEYNETGYRQATMLNLAGFLARSVVNGPGIRAVVWVQGCPFRCRGCFNEQYQPFSQGTIISIDQLGSTILALPGIEGVTFSGGEPFAQAGPLAELGSRLRRGGLTVVTYTGFTAAQISRGTDPSWPRLLSVSDLVITGPFVQELAVPDPLKGSSNQEVISLGTKIPAPCPVAGPNRSRSTEFTIAPDGTITTTGFPGPSLMRRFPSRCGGL